MFETDYDRGLVDVSCDRCCNSERIEDTTDWHDVSEEIKRLGWKIQKNGDDWEHICPNCQ